MKRKESGDFSFVYPLEKCIIKFTEKSGKS